MSTRYRREDDAEWERQKEPVPRRRYSFTRDQLIAALLRLGYRRFVPADSMADGIIEALEDGKSAAMEGDAGG